MKESREVSRILKGKVGGSVLSLGSHAVHLQGSKRGSAV